jgi:hypothetical protein
VNRLCSRCGVHGDMGFFTPWPVVCGICELIRQCVSFGCVVWFLTGRNSTTWVLTVLVCLGLDEALLVVG